MCCSPQLTKQTSVTAVVNEAVIVSISTDESGVHNLTKTLHRCRYCLGSEEGECGLVKHKGDLYYTGATEGNFHNHMHCP